MSKLKASAVSVTLGGKQILDGIDAGFSSGRVTAIVGPNGAGKSTFLSCLCGLRQPSAGNVTLDNNLLSSFSPRERAQKIGLIPQNPEIAWAIDVLTVVQLGRTPYNGIAGLTAVDKLAVTSAMKETATTAFADRDVTTLSGGERARVILARAIAGEPEWLLADEPFAGLDPGNQLEAADIFRRMVTDKGKGVIVTLHDLSLAARMANHIVVLAQGKIIAEGPPETALAPDILARTYGVKTRFLKGSAGPVIEIVGRCD